MIPAPNRLSLIADPESPIPYPYPWSRIPHRIPDPRFWIDPGCAIRDRDAGFGIQDQGLAMRDSWRAPSGFLTPARPPLPCRRARDGAAAFGAERRGARGAAFEAAEASERR